MTRRGGAALVVVLFAISFTSALAVAGVFLSRSFVRSARAAVTGADLFLPAEGALISVLATWDTASRNAQPSGTTVVVPVSVVEATSTRAWITRLGATLYWVQAESSVGQRPVLRRRVGLVVTTRTGMPLPAGNHAWSSLP